MDAGRSSLIRSSGFGETVVVVVRRRLYIVSVVKARDCAPMAKPMPKEM